MSTIKDKVIVITGASDGIGAVVARRLDELGAKVIIVGRSREKTMAIAHELQASYYLADFTKLSDVRRLAANLDQDLDRIDVLINNAGGIMGKREVTVDGNEKTLQVNHLAPFLLTNLLINKLIHSKAKILNTSSIANKMFGHINIDDLNAVKDYSPNKAYGDSKLANILFARELNRRYGNKGIKSVAFHPGNVATSFSSGSTSLLRFLYQTPLKRFFLISPERGADNTIWLATTDEWKPGEYYDKQKITHANKQAYDANLARKLWEQSDMMTAP